MFKSGLPKKTWQFIVVLKTLVKDKAKMHYDKYRK